MSLTCVGLGFLAVSEPTRFGRRVFRIVVGLLATTFVYDLIWLFWLRSSEAENFEDGAGAWWIRKFSLINSYISFFFRIAVIGVFWKVSLNYRSILKKG
jgi:peptidoglycan/LPS O-acetylase OafA/YrhL